MKKLLLSAALLSLVSCTPEAATTTKQVSQSEDFNIVTVQMRTVTNGEETAKEDQINVFSYNSDTASVTWAQEGEKEAWVYKVLVKADNHFTLLEVATEEDEAHTFNLDVNQDKTTVAISLDGSEDINYFEVNRK